MPAKATVFRWLARNEKFRRSYAIAHDCLAEDLMDEILEIVDDSSRDYVEKKRSDQGPKMDVGSPGAEEVPLPLTRSVNRRAPL